MNDTLYRHLTKLDKRANCHRAYWLGTQYKHADEAADAWDEHMRRLFPPAKVEPVVDEQTRRVAQALSSMIRAVPVVNLGELEIAMREELRVAANERGEVEWKQ